VDNVPAVTVEVDDVQEKDEVRGTRFKKRDRKPAASKPAANNDGTNDAPAASGGGQPNQPSQPDPPQPPAPPAPTNDGSTNDGNPNDGRDGCVDGDAGKGNDKKNC
jgi:hypothetical protein